jgi:hypothetical protein
MVFDKFKPGERVLIQLFGDALIGTVIKYAGTVRDPSMNNQRVPMYDVRVIKGKTVATPRVFADWMWRTTSQEIINAFKNEQSVQGVRGG